MKLLRTLAPLLVLVPLACETIDPTPVEELDLWTDAAGTVENATLAKLCTDVWNARMRNDPFEATRRGDPRFLGEVPSISLRAREARRDQLETFLGIALRIDAEALTPDDRLTHELLVDELSAEIGVLDHGLADWQVDPLEGPHLRMMANVELQPYGTARERRLLVERWEKLGNYLRQAGVNLGYGLTQDEVATRANVKRVIGQLEELIGVRPSDSPLVAIATGGGHWIDRPNDANLAAIAYEHMGDARAQSTLRKVNTHGLDRILIPAANDPLSPDERGAFLGAVIAAVDDVYDALLEYRDTLRSGVLPYARDDDHPGIMHVPGGDEAYLALVHRETSLPLEECDPKELHAFGLAEVARIREEIAQLGERVFGTSDVVAIQDRLRNSPDLHFDTREEVEGKAIEALHDAENAMSRYFGRLPKADCEVVRIASYEEKDSTIAYYRAPGPDGLRPGRYFINTYAPETRPRYEAEVLAYHEAIPGHHLQIAIAQELEHLPLFRRHGGSTAFVEGWALYAERLCDEMGLYSGDLDRLGVLSFDAWRACRLVVDTGLHALGWTRKQAVDYLVENTLLARNNIENEVDRYIAWPGQALAYKVGQREILRLRDEVRAAKGEAFSYPEFHDRILENGAVTLSALRGVVGRWLAR